MTNKRRQYQISRHLRKPGITSSEAFQEDMSAKRGGAKTWREPRRRGAERRVVKNQTDLQKSWLEVPGKDTLCKHEELIMGGGSLTLFTGCLCTQWCTGTVSSGWFIRSKQQACIYISSILAFWKVRLILFLQTLIESNQNLDLCFFFFALASSDENLKMLKITNIFLFF